MNKIEFIQSIRQFIADGNTEEALHLLREKISDYDTSIITDTTILESRFQIAKSDFVIKGILPREDYDRTVAQVNFAILELIEKLEKTTVTQPNSSKNKSSGRILHNIPGIMPLGRESRCIVRIAFDDDILTRDFQLTKDTAIQSIRIAEVMGVELLDFNETSAFHIRTITEEEQFLASDDYTQWIFQVKPLVEGKFPLTLKVAVIEEIDGRERKRDIVLEKDIFIISQPLEQSTPPSRQTLSNNQIAFEETNVHLNYKVTENQPASAAPKKKSMTAIVSALATVIFAITGLLVYQQRSTNEPPEIVFNQQDSINIQNPIDNTSEIVAIPETNIDSILENNPPAAGYSIDTVKDIIAMPDSIKTDKRSKSTPSNPAAKANRKNSDKIKIDIQGQKNKKVIKKDTAKSSIVITPENLEENVITNTPTVLEIKTYKVNIKLKNEMKDADILVNGEKPLTVKKNIWGTPKYVEFKSNKKLQSFTFIREGVSCKVENIDVSSGEVSIEACSFKKKSNN